MTPRRVHYVGIGGAGMSALALVDVHRGLGVTGCDQYPGATTKRLESLGVSVFQGHDPAHIRETQPQLVVYTDAVPRDHPELEAARGMNIPVVRRAEYLGTLMDSFAGPRVGVAGTHGKTTTTAMLGEILVQTGFDPTVMIGGDYAPFRGNVRLGRGDVFVTEACEAFRSFHHLHPDVAIVTNVEPDHLDCYGTLEGVTEGFLQFVRGVAPGGHLVIRQGNDAENVVAEEARSRGVHVTTFAVGTDLEADLSATVEKMSADTVQYQVFVKGEHATALHGALSLVGEHNVWNALAACAAAQAIGVPLPDALNALGRFRGVGRRFEYLGERGGVSVIDDYAHHPTEIRATLKAARQRYPRNRIITVFQPHLYSRTRDFREDFARELAASDVVILTEVYRAREDRVESGDVHALAEEMQRLTPKTELIVEPDRHRIPEVLDRICRPGDVVLIVGAGNIREAGERYVQKQGGGGLG